MWAISVKPFELHRGGLQIILLFNWLEQSFVYELQARWKCGRGVNVGEV